MTNTGNQMQDGQESQAPKPFVLESPSRNARLELVLEAGGIINRLVLNDGGRQVETIAGLDPAEAVVANPQYRGVTLFPFPNRLQDGSYEFAGSRYQLPINEEGNHNNLHGFLYSMEPEVVDTSHEGGSASVTLLYAYDGALPGYPFAADVQMEYRLTDSGLTVVMGVVNRASEAMPVGIGWHPYYCLNHESVNDLSLQLPEVERFLVDDRMLPTGETQPCVEFSQLTPVGATAFDDCFEIKGSGDEAQVVLWSEQAKLGLKIWQELSGGLNYLQLCIPPDRRSIAVEPMSCGINAFNTGRDVEVLQPGQKLTGVFGVELITRKP